MQEMKEEMQEERNKRTSLQVSEACFHPHCLLHLTTKKNEQGCGCKDYNCSVIYYYQNVFSRTGGSTGFEDEALIPAHTEEYTGALNCKFTQDELMNFSETE